MPRSPSPRGAASCCRGGPMVPPGHYHTSDSFTGRAETVREGAPTQGTALAGPGWQALPQRADRGRRTAPHRVRGAAAAAGSEVTVWPARRAAGGGWAAVGGGWASAARPSSSSNRRPWSCAAITATRPGWPLQQPGPLGCGQRSDSPSPSEEACGQGPEAGACELVQLLQDLLLLLVHLREESTGEKLAAE